MRGGILLACHHGLDEAQIDYLQQTFAAFADQQAGPRARSAAVA
jgi:CDP-6-deoxy-D-xylo-4-hexulose-3-dehydrase